MTDNPFSIPEWHSIGRETKLVRHLLGVGATSLGRAGYGDNMGEYYIAFFGLSVGLERLAKLVLVVDHAISNDGTMPSDNMVKEYGHKLVRLFDAAAEIETRHDVRLKYDRPTDPISVKIIDSLDAFADARRGRYANFAALGNPSLSKEEPIARWWAEVATLILEPHYKGQPIQTRAEANAAAVQEVTSPFAMVLQTTESGDIMQDASTASLLTAQARVVQKFGRFHALTVVRWLSDLLSKLAQQACYTHRIHAFFGLWEHLETYTVADDVLKGRKVWPLK
ncbi:hypothetical protein [Candidatus Palauibacter sp.]|uniref:hypothetical protein n=1 Tax=Candidatus Palauibacter sp. TaxID=3101350 RepID=UPI003B013B15